MSLRSRSHVKASVVLTRVYHFYTQLYEITYKYYLMTYIMMYKGAYPSHPTPLHLPYYPGAILFTNLAHYLYECTRFILIFIGSEETVRLTDVTQTSCPTYAVNVGVHVFGHVVHHHVLVAIGGVTMGVTKGVTIAAMGVVICMVTPRDYSLSLFSIIINATNSMYSNK